MPAPVSMTGTRAFSRTKRIRPAPPRGMTTSTKPTAFSSAPAARGPRQQGEGRRVDAFAAERLTEQGGDGFVGVTGVAAAFQHAGVARFDAERENVGRDVGPRFADHADHAERHADLAQSHAVGTGPLGDRLALRRGQSGDRLHVGGDRGDALRRQPQAVAHGRIGIHRLQVEGIGRKHFFGVFPQQGGGFRDGAAQSPGVGKGQFVSRMPGGGEDRIVFHFYSRYR